MTNAPKPQGLAPELADAMDRIRETELAIKRTEEMLAANIVARSKIRTAVEVAARLVRIHPTSPRRDTGTKAVAPCLPGEGQHIFLENSK
ncbi:hypothetical protein B5V01_21260 [Mesorhizobium erdmanii]|uniref:Uncharacterized protein n=2 Tax=Mesorhizobium TaxID=68287 RepID=A0A3M9X0N4_9HYPH|nr:MULTISPECIES: hypothetical protein [Mesorhizobium]RNJ41405.1 hypothetical protein DNR46_34310 [Mesorhizobium japonicum]RXT43042.1 hypothetical protein B5V01_21260 [Mesorhizobium erdmanii]